MMKFEIKYVAIIFVIFFLVVTPFVLAQETSELVLDGAKYGAVLGNIVFTIEDSQKDFSFISFISLIKNFPKNLFNINFLRKKKNPDLDIDNKLEEKLKTKDKVRVIIKSNEPIGFVKSSENIPANGETSFSRTFKMTEEVISEKRENYETESKETKLFLDVKTSDSIEVKQIVDAYQAIEVDKRDFNQLQKQVDLGEVIIDEPFSILTEESLEITSTNKVHKLGSGGKGIKICVIDTGVNAEVLGLIPEVNVLGYNVLDNSYDYSDDNGHGTSVMSVLVSFAPDATYYMVKAMDENGKGYSSDIVAGLGWCESQEVDIYSLSIGTGSFDSYCSQDFTAQKVNSIVNKGKPVFAATGNQGNKNSIYSPACSGLAIPVTASTKNDLITDFSNYNSFTILTTPGQGISVINEKGEIVSKQGTSLSTPMVVGIAALILENKNLSPQELETLFVQTGKVIKEEEREFSRVNALNALNGEVINELLPREYPSYEELLITEEIVGEEQIFETLIGCLNAEDCAHSEICIEGTCYNDCNSTFDNRRCSDDSYAYYDSHSGICARNNTGSYFCDKDEVAFTRGVHFVDCYDIAGGAFVGDFPCDSDVNPSYSSEGICSWNGASPSSSTINCDLDEVCMNEAGYIQSDCSVCGYDAEYSCDSNVALSYTQDGVCVSGSACDIGDVCVSEGSFYGNMGNCSDGDDCDTDVDPGYTVNGLVCSATHFGCVINGSVSNGNVCCEDANCANDSCVLGICASVFSDCVPLIGKTFSVKNSTGDLCFEVNTSGDAVFYENLDYGPKNCPEVKTAFQFINSTGDVLGWINSNCSACFEVEVFDSQKFLSNDAQYAVENKEGQKIMTVSTTNVSFAGKACYDYNSGSPLSI